MSFGSENKQSAILRHTWTELNIGAAAGHVGRDRHRSRLARAHYDLCFLHVKFRVQHVVRNFFPLQHSAEQLRRFYAHRADQHRLLLGVVIPDFVNDRVVFFPARFVNPVVVIFAGHRPIRRNHVHVEFVDVVKLGRFGFRGSGHAG